MEFLLEFLLEFVVEVLVQGAFELGFRGLAEPFRKERQVSTAWALFSYVLLGAVGGAISVWLFPMHVLKHPLAQYVNLIITPIALGLAFEWLGHRRESKGKQKMLLDRFSYGFVFALTMGLIRFVFAG